MPRPAPRAWLRARVQSSGRWANSALPGTTAGGATGRRPVQVDPGRAVGGFLEAHANGVAATGQLQVGVGARIGLPIQIAEDLSDRRSTRRRPASGRARRHTCQRRAHPTRPNQSAVQIWGSRLQPDERAHVVVVRQDRVDVFVLVGIGGLESRRQRELQAQAAGGGRKASQAEIGCQPRGEPG